MTGAAEVCAHMRPAVALGLLLAKTLQPAGCMEPRNEWGDVHCSPSHTLQGAAFPASSSQGLGEPAPVSRGSPPGALALAFVSRGAAPPPAQASEW